MKIHFFKKYLNFFVFVKGLNFVFFVFILDVVDHVNFVIQQKFLKDFFENLLKDFLYENYIH